MEKRLKPCSTMKSGIRVHMKSGFHQSYLRLFVVIVLKLSLNVLDIWLTSMTISQYLSYFLKRLEIKKGKVFIIHLMIRILFKKIFSTQVSLEIFTNIQSKIILYRLI